MTISNQESFVIADGNGVTTQFGYSFLIPTAADVVVSITNTTVSPVVITVLNSTQYTITGIGSGAGGLVTYPLSGPALATGFTIEIARVLRIVQDTAISNQGNFYPASVEGALDYLTMVCQDIQGDVDQITAEVAVLTRTDITVNSNVTNAIGTIALLKAMTVTIALVGSIIYVEGYTAAGDGGGGIFYITNSSPGADNGGTIIHSNTAGFYFTRQYSSAINLRWFGAKGDDTTDDSTAAQNWLNTIASGAAGYIPPASANFYKIVTALTHTGFVTIRGDGILSRLHYTGSGVALTLVTPRFSRLENFYLTGTSSAAGGIYIRSAQEGYYDTSLFIDGFSGAGAYARRFSSCFTGMIVGGGSRQGANGLIFDTVIDSASFGGVNSWNIVGHDMANNTLGLDLQAGAMVNVIGCDFSTTITGIEVGRALGSPARAQDINILGNYFESTNCIYVGRGAYGDGAAVYVSISGNYLNGTTNCVHLYKCDSVNVGLNTFGVGANTIDAGVTGTVWANEIAVTDNATAGQTTYPRFNIGSLAIAVSQATNYSKTTAKTVATLTAAATAGAGARSFVTDANSATFMANATGGGSNKVPVVSDGTNWLIG